MTSSFSLLVASSIPLFFQKKKGHKQRPRVVNKSSGSDSHLAVLHHTFLNRDEAEKPKYCDVSKKLFRLHPHSIMSKTKWKMVKTTKHFTIQFCQGQIDTEQKILHKETSDL